MKIQNAIPNKFENLQHYHAKRDNEFFDGECFQQIFGVIIGANIVPIFANLYMTQLENIFKEKHKNDKKKKTCLFYLQDVLSMVLESQKVVK